jgi:hypothetical protein
LPLLSSQRLSPALHPSQAQLSDHPLAPVPALALLALAAVEAELVLPFYHIRQTLV